MTRRHNYVVGYKGEGQCIYASDTGEKTSIELLTLKQAMKLSKNIVTIRSDGEIKAVVYKLVKVGDGREKH